MATYTIKCLSSFFYGGDRWLGMAVSAAGHSSYQMLQVVESTFAEDHWNSFIKFDNSNLSAYKNKKINSIYLYLPSVEGNLLMKDENALCIGGSIEALSTSFDSNTRWSSRPNSQVIQVVYKEVPTSTLHIGDQALELKYYYSGSKDYNGNTIFRNMYDQLPIGFCIANNVNYADKKNVNYFSKDDVSTGNTNFGIIFNLEDWNPILTARFPVSNAFLKYNVTNNFSVAFAEFESIDFPTATSAAMEIKDIATGTTENYSATMSINLHNRNYLEWAVPNGVLAHGKDYQWRTKIITDDGETGYSDWAAFTTKDAIPGAPTILYPQSKYLDGSLPIELAWQHNIDTGSIQYAYDLYYKQTGDWIAIVSHAISAAQKYTLPADFFSAGQMYWEVRTYNTDDVSGTYAISAANIIQAKPVTPIINSITSTPQLSLTWQSTGQQAYRLTITNDDVDFDSGAIYGTTKAFTINTILADGNYEVCLKIQNGQGLWSDCAIQDIKIVNDKPLGDDELIATPVAGGIRLSITLPDAKGINYFGDDIYLGEIYLAYEPKNTVGTRYLLRDGNPIAIMGDTYTDYTCSGEHTYICRIVNNGNYHDTKPVTARPIINYACISKYSDPESVLILKHKENSKPTLENQYSKKYKEHFFAGRALPVNDITEHYNSIWNFSYSFLEKSAYDILYNLFLSGETVIFRDNKGYRAIGTLTSVKSTISNIANTVDFSISETSVSEVISYDI